MKTLLTQLFAILIIISSCSTNTEPTEPFTVKGKIENPNDKVLKIRDFLGKGPWEHAITLEKGLFEHDVKLENPAIMMLNYGNFRKDIYMSPGKILEVSFNTTNLDSSFQYSGDLALENNLLDSLSKRIDQIDYSIAYGDSLELANAYLDSLNLDSKEYLKSLLANNKASEDFAFYSNAIIDYNTASLKIIIGNRQDEQPEGFYDFIDELSFEDPRLLDIPRYRFFLSFFIDLESNTRLQSLDSVSREDPNRIMTENLAVISEMKNDDVRSYSLYNVMVEHLKDFGAKDFESFYEYFKTHNTDPNYLRELDLVYAEKKKITAGQSAPEFTLNDVDGNEVSLKDFEGKYVYLDFWQTLCSRSARELPHYLDLYSEYSDNENIAFVSISVDEDETKWMDYVKENKNVGTSLRTLGNWDSEVYNAYQIYGLPSFVLIDKEGKIVDPKAPKPSSNKIRETLNNLLEPRI